MRILIASLLLVCCAGVATADQGIDPNTTVTVTIGDINALIAAKIAEVNAQNAMAKISAQVQKKPDGDTEKEAPQVKPDSIRKN